MLDAVKPTLVTHMLVLSGQAVCQRIERRLTRSCLHSILAFPTPSPAALLHGGTRCLADAVEMTTLDGVSDPPPRPLDRLGAGAIPGLGGHAGLLRGPVRVLHCHLAHAPPAW